MTQQVSFYILAEETPETRALFACRLAEKAWRNGVHAHIHTAGEEDTKALDSLLWSFREDSFLPHKVVENNSEVQEPVTLGHSENQLKGRKGLLINLGDEIPNTLDSYSRIAEVVVQEESILKLARTRFRQYRGRGLDPQHQKVGRPS
ncbi:DNA polymerase III subunit chi [Sansalvadorimonas sp. 2012CJ34-2]|uniref:DNA polymerase III subunit chi n=1 Tax=Parendozoicomonas callyspongiae TaxID=2942213 RepID=A0ABT0PCF3_9GAMM|nr:DNA polymerase III subunit chi [Sansalvadorimonas sp. 2012CJ34-2]MCL6269055.1 DNA polymerase III subunit chi [Sansalvadorimonas sp. 2012CJ34-2]